MLVTLVEICGSHPLDGQLMVRLEFPDLGNIVLDPQHALQLARTLRRVVKQIENKGDE
jgi:hypothetical protein